LANGAEYTGDYPGATVVDLRDFHARKLEVIQNIVPAVDAMAIETIPSLEECQALRDLFTSREEGSLLWKDAPMGCWISLACRNGRELNDGTPVVQALQVLAGIPRSAVQAFGFNCGHGRDLCSLLAILLAHYYEDDSNTHKPRGIVLYPNAGEDWNAATADWVEGTGCTHPADLAHVLMACIRQIETSSAKANTAIPRIVVGGCCRTTPAAMASLRAQVDQHLQETG
jgi:homocysteine S-methyltransferase